MAFFYSLLSLDDNPAETWRQLTRAADCSAHGSRQSAVHWERELAPGSLRTNRRCISPEDNILAKLEWYRMEGEVSDRQWQDVLNVLKVQGDRLDMGYLGHWAVQLAADLLKRALGEM